MNLLCYGLGGIICLTIVASYSYRSELYAPWCSTLPRFSLVTHNHNNNHVNSRVANSHDAQYVLLEFNYARNLFDVTICKHRKKWNFWHICGPLVVCYSRDSCPFYTDNRNYHSSTLVNETASSKVEYKTNSTRFSRPLFPCVSSDTRFQPVQTAFQQQLLVLNVVNG